MVLKSVFNMSLELMCCLFGFYFNRNVLVRVTVTIVKHRDQNNLGRKGFVYLMVPHHSLPKEVRTGAGCRSWWKVAVNGLLSSLLSLLSCRTQDHEPMDGTVHNGLWGFIHQSLVKNVPYIPAYTLIFVFVCFVYVCLLYLHVHLCTRRGHQIPV